MKDIENALKKIKRGSKRVLGCHFIKACWGKNIPSQGYFCRNVDKGKEGAMGVSAY